MAHNQGTPFLSRGCTHHSNRQACRVHLACSGGEWDKLVCKCSVQGGVDLVRCMAYALNPRSEAQELACSGSNLAYCTLVCTDGGTVSLASSTERRAGRDRRDLSQTRIIHRSQGRKCRDGSLEFCARTSTSCLAFWPHHGSGTLETEPASLDRWLVSTGTSRRV